MTRCSGLSRRLSASAARSVPSFDPLEVLHGTSHAEVRQCRPVRAPIRCADPPPDAGDRGGPEAPTRVPAVCRGRGAPVVDRGVDLPSVWVRLRGWRLPPDRDDLLQTGGPGDRGQARGEGGGGLRCTSAPSGFVKDISPQLQNHIAPYRPLPNQVQGLTRPRMRPEAKLRQGEGTPGELHKLTGETPIYKSIGMLLVRQDDREGLKKELEEHKETLTIRVKSLQKQEKALSERYEDLATKIQAALGTSPAAAEGN